MRPVISVIGGWPKSEAAACIASYRRRAHRQRRNRSSSTSSDSKQRVASWAGMERSALDFFVANPEYNLISSRDPVLFEAVLVASRLVAGGVPLRAETWIPMPSGCAADMNWGPAPAGHDPRPMSAARRRIPGQALGADSWTRTVSTDGTNRTTCTGAPGWWSTRRWARDLGRKRADAPPAMRGTWLMQRAGIRRDIRR